MRLEGLHLWGLRLSEGRRKVRKKRRLVLQKKRSLTYLVFVVASAILFSACATPAQKPVVTAIPPDYELKDVRELPQDFSWYANPASVTAPDGVWQAALFAEFTRKYYAPWRGGAPLSDLSRTVQTMKDHVARDWYGENRRRVPEKILDELLVNCDLAHFPSMNSRAIAIFPASLRVLPTARPFFVVADDFPFDALQNAGLKMNEPLRVLHISADGVWAFAETSDANGWVPMRDIGFIRESQATEWARGAHVVIVKDFAPIRNRQEQFALRVKAGTLFPLAREDSDAYEVFVAVRSANNGVREISVRVPKDSARRFPLEMNAEDVALIGNELIGKSYGWGELYQDRDCSSLMRDFFLPFGIWLPRGSYNQIHSGKSISFSGLSTGEKERLIIEKGIPFRTILYMKGHIMLYVGSENGKALIFQSLWKVKVKDADGRVVKQIVGKAVITTLTPGSELSLADATLLEKVSSMRILGGKSAFNRGED